LVTPVPPTRLRDTLDNVAGSFTRLDPALYALWAGVTTLSSGRMFYSYMLKQTRGEWSAPLDDVFIHFDYARATAEGHPFEWVVGNGYSSGNTSVTYPFALALGYLGGFRQQHLMVWAALIAAASVLATLLVARKLVLGKSPDVGDRLASYLLPPVFLAVGALDWTLWSGMEVAFFLGTWAVALLAYLSLVAAPAEDDEARGTREWRLGAAGALMILTRPESVSTLVVFGIGALWALRRRLGLGGATLLGVRVLGPGAAVVLAQAGINRWLTGEWTANGAIVKLALYNPFLTNAAKWDDYVFNVRYEIFRNLEYHFTDYPPLGVLLPALGMLGLAVKKTRGAALLLWGQVAGWALLVGLNGQVRWQNERYTMPAVAWMLIAAAIGAGVLLRRIGRPAPALVAMAGVLGVQAIIAARLPEARPSLPINIGLSIAGGALLSGALFIHPTRVLAVIAALALFHVHHVSKMRDQKWFFGRACRNILDQHIETGRWLREVRPRRVLVGDAGALIYASDRPGLDIIGLGGYHALPFARAGVQGLTATIELMEHLRPEDLPDVMAIYPTWWGILPNWFGAGVVARTPATGNVICGGYEDVVYLADWHLLRTGEAARGVPAGMTVKDTVDVADLVSEKQHHYVFAAPHSGFTDLKILADPADATRDLLDGGRELKPGFEESMHFSGLVPGQDAAVVLRAAPVDATTIHLRVSGQALPPLAVAHTDAWIEPVFRVPARLVSSTLDVAVINEGPNDFVDYHVWVAQ